MSLASSLFFAWQSITRQRLRSLLALAGIAMGAFAIVSAISLEQAWLGTVDRAFAGMNLNRIVVNMNGDFSSVHLKRKIFTDEDATAIKQQCPAAERVTSSSYASDVDIHAGRERAISPVVVGIDPDYDVERPLHLIRGRLLTRQELLGGAHVCVVTPQLHKALFPGHGSVGQMLRLEGVAFQVIGTVAWHGLDLAAPTNVLYMPRSLYRNLFHRSLLPDITVYARDPDLACQQIDALLRQRIGGDERVWYATSPWLARQIARSVRRDVQLIGMLAALCVLLLGGYGVGSVLYISVAESAREVGVRRAMGASRASVALEAVCAGILFGIIGAGIGLAVSKAGAVLAALPPTTVPGAFKQLMIDRGGREFSLPQQFSVSISWQAVLLGVLSPLVVCVLASVEPALEMMGLNPARVIAVGLIPNRRLRVGLAISLVCIAVAVIALLPALYDALDRRDRSYMRSTHGGGIRVAAYDLTVARWSGTPPGWRPRIGAAFRKAVLSPDFGARLRAACPHVAAVMVTMDFRPESIRQGGKLLFPRYDAVSPFWQVIFVPATYYPRGVDRGHGGRIKHGEFFTADMTQSKARVCVLDSQATLVAFGDENGVGKKVRVNGVPFTVVGTMAGGALGGRVGRSTYTGQATIYLPISVYDEVRPALLSGGATTQAEPPSALKVEVGTKDEESVPAAAQELRKALPRLLPGVGEHLFLSEPTYGSLGEYFSLRGLAAKRSAFSAVMLLVIALIGLADMLLVSLNEMKRELGVRRTLGAQKWQVMLPIVAEGGLLAIVGSALGILIAWGLSFLIRARVFEHGVFSFSLFWAGAACLTMILTALLVSLIPGLLATRVNPVQALREE